MSTVCTSVEVLVRNRRAVIVASTGCAGPDALDHAEQCMTMAELSGIVDDLAAHNRDMGDEELNARLLDVVYARIVAAWE